MADLNFSVNDNLGVAEALNGTPNNLNLSVSEPVVVGDYGDIWHFIQVSDDIVSQEIINVFQPELGLFAYEDIGVTESFSRPLEINLFEFFFTTDFAVTTWGLAYRAVDDSISCAEYAELAVVQIFSVYEVTSIIEIAEAKVGRALSGFSSVVVDEFLNIARDILYNDINETVSVIEYAILGREVEMLNAQDDLVVLEVAIAEITLDLSFNDFLRSYPFDEETLTNIIVEQFENGAEQRRDKWGRTRKRFGVNFNPRSKDEIDALRTFFVSRRGPANAFDFISPLDNVDYLVRFEENSLQISRTAYGIYQAQVTLVEVFR